MLSIFGTGVIVLGHVDDLPVPEYTDVRIDRKTIFGNPYPKGEHGTRSEVCAKYAVYAQAEMKKKGDYAKAIKKLRRRYRAGESFRLLCHCVKGSKVRQCHGETVRKLIMG